MLRKPFHGWTIKQEIPRLTALRTPSRLLNMVRVSPGSATRPTPLTSLSPVPPKSHFRFAHLGLSTSSLATGPSAAPYYSRAPEPEPSTLPEERALLFTCVSEDDGECRVYGFETEHNSQELCRERTGTEFFFLGRDMRSMGMCPCLPVTLESLKQNPEVINKLEVHPRDMHDVAKEQLRKYVSQVMPIKEKVANMLEAYLGREFRVAYEKAIEYGFGVMVHHFPLQVALCRTKPLSTKISLIRGSLAFETTDLLVGPWKRQAHPSRFSRLWRICLLRLLEWIQSSTYFGPKK